jgi:phosphotransferase system IIA component
MDFLTEITEEALPKLHHRYYNKGQEVKVGDKLIFAFTDILDEHGKEVTTIKSFILDVDKQFFYELKEEK